MCLLLETTNLRDAQRGRRHWRQPLNRAAQRAPSVGAAVAARAWRSRKGEAFKGGHAIAADPPPPRRGGPADARDARPCGVAGTDAETRN